MTFKVCLLSPLCGYKGSLPRLPLSLHSPAWKPPVAPIVSGVWAISNDQLAEAQGTVRDQVPAMRNKRSALAAVIEVTWQPGRESGFSSQRPFFNKLFWHCMTLLQSRPRLPRGGKRLKIYLLSVVSPTWGCHDLYLSPELLVEI